MATNEVLREGDALSLPVPASTVAGSPVLVGSIIGVAQTDRASSTNFGGGNPVNYATVWCEGVHKFNVVGATTIGLKVYVVQGTPATLTATAGSNALFGYALAAQSTDGIIPVRIAQI